MPGLLTPQALDRLLTDAIRRRQAADSLLMIADRVAAAGVEPMSMEEVDAEVKVLSCQLPAACGPSLTLIYCDVLTSSAEPIGKSQEPMRTDVGISLQILNNQDYSCILRGNLARAAAWAKPPRHPRVENDFVLLDESPEGAKPSGKARPGRLSEAARRGHKVAGGADSRLISNFGAHSSWTAMLEKVRRLFGELHGGSKHSGHFNADDYRVAAAALLVHVATLDHDLTGPARQKLGALLMAQFSLTDQLTDELIEAAVAADREAVDFYHFTHLLMRTLDEQGRLRVVEMLWKMAVADGAISEFEDNVMWRVADLLAVSPRDRIALRQQVMGQVVGNVPNKGAT